MSDATGDATTPRASACRVFVNERGVDVPDGATVLDAVRAASVAEAEAVSAGRRSIVDSRGLPAAPDAATYAGAIYRTVAVRSA